MSSTFFKDCVYPTSHRTTHAFVKSFRLLTFRRQESVIVTDLIAQSFIKIFNNAFLNTIERVRPLGPLAGQGNTKCSGLYLVHASATPDTMGDVPMGIPGSKLWHCFVVLKWFSSKA